MKMRKVPRDLLAGMQNANKDAYRFERMERYVINYLLEAGHRNVPIDEVFIKAGYKLLQYKEVMQHSPRAA